MPAPTPPEKKPDRHYDFRGTNIVFALCSLGLLAVTLLMVIMDYGRPWKRVQAEFRDLERQSIVRDLEQEQQAINEQQMATVLQEITAAEEGLEQRGSEVEAFEDSIAVLDKRVFESDKLMRARKTQIDAAKWQYDIALQDGGERSIASAREKIDTLTLEWQQYQRATEAYIEQREAEQDKLAEVLSTQTRGEGRLGDLNAALDGLNTRLSTVEKDLDYFMLNAPLMDFLAPSLKIEQVVLPGLFHDIQFAKIDRVDRCMTCHVASNRDGFDGEEWTNPYRSHPRLDLFVADASPHPYGRFGCTVCHAGLDRATDFSRAGHSPVDDEQRDAWIEKYNWESQPFLHTPILPLNMTEAGCIGCHADEVWTPQATVQDTGRQLINKLGCYGCHQIGLAAFEDLPKVGPDLTKVASKVDDAWAATWIEAPRKFRPTTWMPHFFFQVNIEGEVNQGRQRAEIEAIVDFLWSVSEEVEYAPAPAGDATRGEDLFYSIGCTGCHILDSEAERADFTDALHRLHGPNLAGLGSKVSRDWVYAWLRDPKSYRPDTAMPNLRLTDQEAADLSTFVVASRRPEFENLERAELDEGIRAELVATYLRQTMTIEQSEARVLAMSAEEQSVYLGERSITKYGCFGCHNIAGFADVKPIGVELTEEASKPLHLFDFGHLHDLPHTHRDWLRTKITTPRIFDQGKELVLNYSELAKMPNFGLSDAEAEAVLANLIGFRKESVLEDRKAGRGERGENLAAGRRIVTRFNCQGCHLIEEVGHAIRAALRDENNLPPNLAAEGVRTQADWLFSFLHDPSQVSLRPWLDVRMPTFQFSDEQANDLVAYFASIDEADPFASEPEAGSARSRAIGEEIFNMLQCAKCHPASADAIAASGGAVGELAPSLLLARERLRHEWVPHWIKDPQGFIPGTKMPTNFPTTSTGGFSSPLGMAINQATYAGEKRRMMRYFDSEEGLNTFLSDVDLVSAALRDHIWTMSN